jgi:peptidoglycan/xylan/chitin deacetylase (PgdA/CDA1 family)
VKPIVSITFDDGLRCQFERAVPVLNKLGMQATFFLIANRNPTHDLWSGHTDDWWKIDWRPDDIAMLKTLVRDGHEIGSHSVSHHPDTLKMPEQAKFEARESKRLIEDWIGTQVSSFCYPFYWSHGYLADSVRNAGYGQARGGGVAPDYVPAASYYDISESGCLDRFNIDCRQISQNENVSEWLKPGCWHVLTFHAIGADRDGWEPITEDQFLANMAELARYRDTGTVEVLTFANAATRFSQRGELLPVAS